MFDEIDVSDWQTIEVEQLGTKPKQWLLQPDPNAGPGRGAEWLWKQATFNRRRDGSSYRKGDDWAERVATLVGDELGVPVAQVELAFRTDRAGTNALGVVSRRMLTDRNPTNDDEETLVHGNELLAEIGIVRSSARQRDDYTWQAIQAALADIAPPTPPAEGGGAAVVASAWDWFVGYLVLDALVGNVDRHQENWAVITTSASRRLAPSFDHASSLGFQLDDADRSDRLMSRDRNRTPAGYADRARSRFDGQPHPVDVAVEALRSVDPVVARHWTGRIDAVAEAADLLDRLPPHRCSAPASRFAAGILDRNRARLLSQLEGTVPT